MRKTGLIKQLLSSIVLSVGLTSSLQTANFNTNCLEAASPSTGHNCTANDASISDFRIIWIGDGCVNSADRAEVKMSVTIAESTSKSTYNVGLFINTEGGDAVGDNTTIDQCLHEALIPVGLVTDSSSGIGPFLDLDADTCGDISNSAGDWNRTIINAADDNIFTVSCSDSDGNGYVDFNWATAWGTSGCTGISDAVANGKSKCGSGTNDTFGTANSIAIGVPDLSTTIDCQLKQGTADTLTCTVNYINNSPVGPGDYIEFHIDYNGTQADYGSTVSLTDNNSSDDPDTINSSTDGTIVWTLDDGVAIAPDANGTFVFELVYDTSLLGDDVNVSVMGYYNNGVDTPVAQPALYDEWVVSTNGGTTLPVTIGYVYPQKTGSTLDVSFSTATEVGNVGFNIYGIKGHQWIKLNDEIIPGALDSFEPQDYQVSIDLPEDIEFNKIGIAGVDVNGKEDRHGAFKIGHESGSKAEVVKIDWEKVNKQVEVDKKARRAAKKAKKSELKDQMINLGVLEDAVYRVTHDDLMDQGINLVEQKAKNIAISFKGEGVARYIDGLNKNDKWTKDSWIEFMGSAPKGSDKLYISVNQYQLSLDKSLVVESEEIEPMKTQKVIFEVNKRYGNLIPSDDPFYDGFFYAKGNQEGILTRQFNLPMLEDGKSKITVYVSTFSDSKHRLMVNINGEEVANRTTDGRKEWPIEILVDNSLLNEGVNDIKLTAISEDGKNDFYAYDKLVVSYDVIDPIKASSTIIAIEEKITKESINPKNGINYIIIAHPMFLGERLNQYIKSRESIGWKIQLVNVDDIYSAYGYGMPTPNAIKDYLIMAERKDVTHVQLVGSSSYDYHDYLGLGSVSFIPSIYVNTGDNIKYTPSDTAFVINDKNIPQLAIGRWPVRTHEDLESVIEKSLNWKLSGQSTSQRALFIADKNEENINFSQQMEFLAQKFEANKWDEIDRIYLDDFITNNSGDIDTAVSSARKSILETFNQGPSIVSYSGHSSPSIWSYDALLKESDISYIENYEKVSMVLPFACYTTYADSPTVNTLAHQFLVAGKSGAVLLYGSTMFSSYLENGMIASKVMDYLFEGDTIGEAVLKSKNALGLDYQDTILNGSLLGDVTLKLR